MAAGSGAAFDEVPDSVYTHTEIQATHANTHGISIGIGYPGFYARKVNGDYPSVLVEHRAAASASRGIEVVLNHDMLGRRCAKLPVHDGRPAEEILGYDESGLPR